MNSSLTRNYSLHYCADERTRTSNPCGIRTSSVRVYQIPPRPRVLIIQNFSAVPKRGLEPPRACAHSALNAARLPVPPLRHEQNFNTNGCFDILYFMITIDDFKKVEIKVGTVIACEKIEGSEKLLKLDFDFGDEKRQIVSGIANSYEPEGLIGMQIPVIVNLEPRKLMGFESQGMILAASANGKPVILCPYSPVDAGSSVG